MTMNDLEYNERIIIEKLEAWQEKYKNKTGDALLHFYYKGQLEIGTLIDKFLDECFIPNSVIFIRELSDTPPSDDQIAYNDLKAISKMAIEFGLI